MLLQWKVLKSKQNRQNTENNVAVWHAVESHSFLIFSEKCFLSFFLFFLPQTRIFIRKRKMIQHAHMICEFSSHSITVNILKNDHPYFKIMFFSILLSIVQCTAMPCQRQSTFKITICGILEYHFIRDSTGLLMCFFLTSFI